MAFANHVHLVHGLLQGSRDTAANPFRAGAMIRSIECLLALEETRHFGAAARRLGMSQPSLSQSIAGLERKLGIRLVERSRNFSGFTSAGEAVVINGRRVLRSIEDLRDAVNRCRPDAQRRFVVGIIPITTFVAPMLSELLIRHQVSTSLAVEVGDMHFVARGLRERKLDAGIVYLVPDLLRDMVQYELYEESYCLICSPDANASPGHTISWQMAARLPLGLLSPEMLNRRLIDQVFSDKKLEPTILVESDSILSLLTHVEKGLCAAVVPASSVASLLGIGQWLVRPLVDPVISHPVGLVMLRDVVATPRGQLIERVFRDMQTGSPFGSAGRRR